MAQTAADEILGWRSKLGKAANWLDKQNQPSKKATTTKDDEWGDQVRANNEEFRKRGMAAKTAPKAAAKKPAKKTAVKKYGK